MNLLCVRVKTTKSDRSRRVPLIRACAEGRDADERLFVTESGHRLYATAFKRTLTCAATSEGPPHPRSAPHSCVSMADPRRRRGHRVGLDRTRIGRDHQSLFAPPGDLGGPVRIGPSEPAGAQRAHQRPTDQNHTGVSHRQPGAFRLVGLAFALVELRGFEPLTSSMPWWRGKCTYRTASNDGVH